MPPSTSTISSEIPACPPDVDVDILEPIAIVGISCRLPGSVRTPSQLWDLLRTKTSTFTPIPPSRFNQEGFYHPVGARQGSLNIPGGHFIDSPALGAFDTAFFGIHPREAASMDPQQRMLLETVWECFESSGTRVEGLRGKNVGVYVGEWTCDFADMQLKEPDVEPGFWITGAGRAILSNRVSYVFDFKGPSMTLDTGCSASGMALHVACQALRDSNNITHSALVGGTNLFINPEMAMSMTTMGVLSPTGPCKTFDAKADGYARGEGICCIYLKRLSDALRDGDPVRALIRSSAVNADGKTLGLASPSASSQEACIREAYARAGISNISATAFFECHGTGTVAGDPAEARSIGRVFGPTLSKDDPLYIGSIKPSLGHGEGASALNGVLKGVLALEAGQLPPNLYFEEPNPKIHFDAWKLRVPTELLPWPKNKAKRVSVASYGYGGANAHVVLESLDYYLSTRPHLLPSTGILPQPKQFLFPYGDDAIPTMPAGPGGAITAGTTASYLDRPFLLIFSAKTEDSVKTYIKRLAEMIARATGQDEPANKKLLDLAYTLGTRRSVLPVKAYSVISTSAAGEEAAFTIARLAEHLHNLSESVQVFPEPQEPTRIGFVFTGQGAQWAQMGMTLMDIFPSVRQTIAKLESMLATLPDPPQWRIESELRKPRAESKVNEPQFAQVLCTAVQIALVDLLCRWNVMPRAVVGHSSGEIAAAYASGALKAGEAIILAYYRGKVCERAAASHIYDKNSAKDRPAGGMLAVGLGKDEVAPYLAPFEGKLLIGCVNSPKNVTISGDSDAIEQLEKTITESTTNTKEPIFTRRLKVPLAYHSHHMKQLGGEYQDLLEQPGLQIPLSPKVGRCPMFSSVIGSVLDGRKVTTAYWRQNLESPVEFSTAVQKLVKDTAVNTLIEIGPHSALSAPIREIREEMGLKPRQLSYIPTLIRGNNCVASALELVGTLFAQGYTDVALDKVNLVERVDPDKGEVEVVEKGSVVVDAPFYAWDHFKEYWFESRRSKEWRFRKHPRHDLLGSKVTGTDLEEWQWMNLIGPNNTKWLKDHKVRGTTVMPAVGYIAMAIEALIQILETAGKYDPTNAFYAREISIQKPFAVNEHTEDGRATEVYTTMHPTQVNLMDVSKWYQFTIRSTGEDGAPVKHCTGYVCSDQRRTNKKLPGKDGKRLREVSGDKLYRALKPLGFDHGGWFRGLEKLRVVTNGGREIYAKMVNYSRPEAWEEQQKEEGQKASAPTKEVLEKNEKEAAKKEEQEHEEILGKQNEAERSEGKVTPDSVSGGDGSTASPSPPTSSEVSVPSSPSSVVLDSTSSASGEAEADSDPDSGEADSVKPTVASAKAEENAVSSAESSTATTRVSPPGGRHVESRYPVHPINLDIPVQLVFVTVFAGRLSTMTDIFVPVFIEEIYIASPAPDASGEHDLHCSVDFTLHFAFPKSDCHAWDSTGQEIFHLKNMQGMEIGSTLQAQKASKPPDNFRMLWEVDFDFVQQEDFESILQLHVPESVQGGPENNVHDVDHEIFGLHHFVTLLAAEMLHVTDDVQLPEQSPPHFRLYRRWLEHLLSDELGMKKHRIALCGGKDVDVRLMTSSERQQEIESLVTSMQERVEGRLAYTIYQNFLPMSLGEKNPLETLSKDGMWDAFQAGEGGARMSHYQTAMARLYSRKYARANVLQIGGGFGGGTQAILQGMTKDAGGGVMERCYGSFTFTDADADAVKRAKEKFTAYSGMEFSTLDLAKDMGEQDFEKKKYEVIYALNALHLNDNIPSTLKKIAGLLTPGGKLIVTETLGGPSGHFYIPFIMGTLPTWWALDSDSEKSSSMDRLSPLLPKEQWLSLLEGSEFIIDLQQDDRVELRGNTLLVLTCAREPEASTEFENSVKPTTAGSANEQCTGTTPQAIPSTSPSNLQTSGQSTPAITAPPSEYTPVVPEPVSASSDSNHIVILHRHSITPIIKAFGAKLSSTCADRQIVQLSLSSIFERPPQKGSFIISLLELEGPLLAEITEAEFANLKQVLAMKESYLLWVTSGAHLSANRPELAIATGFMRALRSEQLSFRLNLLDLSTQDIEIQALCVSKLFTMLSSRPASMKNLEELDWEFCEYGGLIYVPRLVADNKTRVRYGNQGDQLQTKMEPFRQEEKNLTLMVSARGMLSSLVWKDLALGVLEPDHVEVQVVANGLNFKDVATAMGLVPYKVLGTEWAGVVLRVGSAVTKVKPGDRVTGMAPNCFANKLHVWDGACVKVPDTLQDISFAELMACNVVYSTAIRSLFHLGRLMKGETVLIHSAAGGVGLAAIQLCKMIGVEIYATCGTPEKRKVLIEEHGIPEDHIFSSRDTSFGEGIMNATNNRGVDVILNSLPGDLLHESLRCLAAFGRFLEIGKRDILLRGRIDLHLLMRNNSFATMDLSELWAARHPHLTPLMQEWLDLLAAGKISPVHPIKEFSVTDVEQAFRYMSTGTHMGKIVITANPNAAAGELVRVGQGAAPPQFEPEATYLIVGGMGGIGSSLAVWLAENGARHLSLMTRSGPTTDEAKKALQDIEAMGCQVQLMRCDVGDAEAVERAIRSVERPICGTIHAAMSLKDGIFEDMTHADFKEPMHAKVTGLMNLHHSLQQANQQLKFFVVLSSFVGVIGNPGQTNYAGAGTFQDAFVRYRHKLGLPATVIDLGMVTEVGYVARNPETEKRLRGLGFTSCEEWHMHQLVRMAIDNPMPPAPNTVTSTLTPASPRGILPPQQFTSAQLVAGIFITDVPKMSTKFVDPKWSIIHSTGLGINPDSDLFGDESGFPDPFRDIDTRPAEEVITELCVCIIRKTASMTGVPKDEIKEDHSLKRYGMDSLVAVELRNWLMKLTTVELAAADILNAPSIRDMSERIFEGYKAKGSKN